MNRGIVLLGLALFTGCSPQEPQKPPPHGVKQLFRTMGCTNCHDIGNTIGGPSFEAIAARYPAHPDTIRALAKRVMQGVRDRWSGQPLEECPNKTGKGFKDYEIRWMVEWILQREWVNPASHQGMLDNPRKNKEEKR